MIQADHGGQAEEAAIALALARGYLRPEQVERRRAHHRALRDPSISLLALLTRYDLPPEHRSLVWGVFQQGLAGDGLPNDPGSAPAGAPDRAPLPVSSGEWLTLTAPAQASSVGPPAQTRIGPYAVTGSLGQGGMGMVLRARDARGAEVALKLLRMAADGHGQRRFERERRLLASLGEAHGFVPLLDAGDDRLGPYLVMTLCEGGNLRARLERGPVPVAETVALGRRLAGAMAAAHERGIVHRDLKPENVLFTRDHQALVADLGLAKHFRDDVPGATWTVSISRQGECMGTIGYMAPEQMEDANAAGPEADVFALGAILYECLSGQPAFEGTGVIEVVGLVMAGEREALSSIAPGAPPWLVEVIERALAHDPTERYADAAALERALAGEGPAAPARSAGDPSSSRATWRGAARPALIALGLTSVLAIALVTWSRRSGPPADGGPERGDEAGAGSSVDAGVHAGVGEPGALVAQAQALLAGGDAVGAIAAATRALNADPGRASAWEARGAARLVRGDLQGALADLDRAIELAPDVAAAHGRRGQVHQAAGAADAARVDLTCALELDPTLAWAQEALARATPASGPAQPLTLEAAARALSPQAAQAEVASLADASEAAALQRRARARWRLDDRTGALVDLSRALERSPTDGALWIDIGLARLAEGDLLGALDAAEQAVKQAPRRWSSWCLRGRVRERAARLAEAAEDFTTASELAPHEGEPLGRLAYTSWRGTHTGQERLQAERAIELGYRTAETLFVRGDARRVQGEHQAALVDFDEASSLDSDLPGLHRSRALALLSLRRYADALRELERACQREPALEEDGALARHRGFAHLALGELDTALRWLDRAVVAAPTDPLAWSHRGEVRVRRGELDLAEPDLERALALWPSSPYAWNARGLLEAARGEDERALANFAKAIEFDPGFAAAYQGRAALHLARGRRDDARRDLARALELEPDRARRLPPELQALRTPR